MDDLAKDLALKLEKPVTDKTGLTGNYDIKLKWSKDQQLFAEDFGRDKPTAPSIFTVLKNTLGVGADTNTLSVTNTGCRQSDSARS